MSTSFGWEGKGMVHSVSGWTRGVQVKLWDRSFENACHTWAPSKVCLRQGAIPLHLPYQISAKSDHRWLSYMYIKSPQMRQWFSAVSAPNYAKFVHDTERSWTLSYVAAFQNEGHWNMTGEKSMQNFELFDPTSVKSRRGIGKISESASFTSST